MFLALELGSVRAVILVPERLPILCCTGPAAHTSWGGFTHRFAFCSHCVCDNKPQPQQYSLLQTYYIPPGAAGWLKRAEMANSVVGGWKERTQQLAGMMEPLVEWCEWPPSREQRRRGNQKSAVCMKGSVGVSLGGVSLSLLCNRHQSTRNF